MRKVIAALLVVIFTFNLVGYRFVVDYLQQNASENLEQRIDNNQFDESQLIEMKTPLHLPYQSNWSDYERCYGEIRLNNIVYSYVKRKIYNDTLFVMCIPNTKKMQLETSKDDFFRHSVDLNAPDNSKKQNSSKTISSKNTQSEYDEYSFAIALNCQNTSSEKQLFSLRQEALASSPHLSPEQPPEELYS